MRPDAARRAPRRPAPSRPAARGNTAPALGWRRKRASRHSPPFARKERGGEKSVKLGGWGLEAGRGSTRLRSPPLSRGLWGSGARLDQQPRRAHGVLQSLPPLSARTRSSLRRGLSPSCCSRGALCSHLYPRRAHLVGHGKLPLGLLTLPYQRVGSPTVTRRSLSRVLRIQQWLSLKSSRYNPAVIARQRIPMPRALTLMVELYGVRYVCQAACKARLSVLCVVATDECTLHRWPGTLISPHEVGMIHLVGKIL